MNGRGAARLAFTLAGALAAAFGLVAAAAAAPFKPSDDAQILERLPQRQASAQQRELAALRSRSRAAPADAEAAVALAQRLFEAWAADGDPRHLGHAQAALARWWNEPRPDTEVRVMRAVLRQLNHEFDAARDELRAVVAEQPEHAPAWSWLAAIAMVQADFDAARSACAALSRLQAEPEASGCQAQVDAASGRAEPAARALAMAADAAEAADEKALALWLLTRLAETEERLGRHEAADASFRRALALGRGDGYLLAAYADFLLDRGRAAEVMTLLKDEQRSDTLLLRLAIAGKRLGHANAGAHRAALTARFDAARERGDTLHRKEEARFALDVLGDAARALPLAAANFQQQREPADARLLLEAALAAAQPQAAAPALRWLNDSKLQSVVLQSLTARLQAGR